MRKLLFSVVVDGHIEPELGIEIRFYDDNTYEWNNGRDGYQWHIISGLMHSHHRSDTDNSFQWDTCMREEIQQAYASYIMRAVLDE